MKALMHYLRYRRKIFGMLILFFAIYLITFALFRMPMTVFLYPSGLCLLAGIAVGALDCSRVWKRHRMLQQITQLPVHMITEFPEPNSVVEEDYREIIQLLCEQYRGAVNDAAGRYREMMDYYTIWAHQIKTPIASMRLAVQNEDSELSRKVRYDLNRIESYVEMVLAYLRLDSTSSDYVLKSYELDPILRSVLRKQSGMFIGKKLGLDFQETGMTVVTDEKWLAFVVDQVLSNALKYTREGKISVYTEGGDTLVIRDTGIGIAPEDLPRVFENGYTGFNGRMEKKASGIGLYLCKRICKNLGHHISIQSKEGVGTEVRIRFDMHVLRVE